MSETPNPGLPVRRSSIKQKQTLVIMLTSCVSLLLACGGFVAYEVITFRKSILDNLTLLGDMLANNSVAAIQFNGTENAQEALALLRSEPSIEAAWVLSRDGSVFAEYRRKTGQPMSLPLLAEGQHIFERDALILKRAIRKDGAVIGAICLRSNLSAFDARLWRARIHRRDSPLISAFVAFLLSLALQKGMLRPILELAEVARGVAAGQNYSVRARKYGEDEIGTLIDGFNEMLRQIQERDVALQAARDGLEKRVAERTGELQMEIVERRKAEQALWESEQLYAQIALNASDLLYVVHTQTGQIDWFGQIDGALGYGEGSLAARWIRGRRTFIRMSGAGWRWLMRNRIAPGGRLRRNIVSRGRTAATSTGRIVGGPFTITRATSSSSSEPARTSPSARRGRMS